jgi:hypothetical protein
MAIEPDGRRWGALIDLAQRRGALLRIKQPGFDVGSPGYAVTVAANTAAGRTVPLAGVQPGYEFRLGQWVSLVVEGRRYLDKLAAPTSAAGDGTAMIELTNLLRAPLSAGDAVEVAFPKIEGSIDGDVGGAWERSRNTAFSFTVMEDA